MRCATANRLPETLALMAPIIAVTVVPTFEPIASARAFS